MEIEVTTIGERGQVVIPLTLRENMSIHKGDKFMILERGDILILKKIKAPSAEDIEKMLKKGHDHAKRHNLSEKDMFEALKKTRSQWK